MIDTSKIEKMPEPLTQHELTIASNAVQVQAEMVHSLRQSASIDGFHDDAKRFGDIATSLDNLSLKFREHAAVKVG